MGTRVRRNCATIAGGRDYLSQPRPRPHLRLSLERLGRGDLCFAKSRGASGEKPFPAGESASRPPHSSGAPPRNAPTPACAGIFRERTAATAAAALRFRSATAVRCGWRRLRPLRSRRLRRFVARARPFVGIAFLRKLRTRHRRLTALQPAPTPPALPCGRSAPRRVLRAGCARSIVLTLSRREALGRSLSLRRSRFGSQRSLSPVGCLMIARGVRLAALRRERLGPSAPQGRAVRARPPP
ncbi:hypothetical protein Oter_4461 [Opitutus terrae PB90-1]|uniref:Uncharacterized protein n=1 Tax=Opitutus terrae (strain DSM 11246 / JCM 15787 / PB90-1) TaxID=452637 RepID=B1ZQ13_OPITP|nr:hypothetical protein Oter_4461 [Opitutus terrae PB90-1]